MQTIMGVAAAGAVGALARYGIGGWIDQRFPGFPWGTLVINVTGSFLLGLLFVIFTERTNVSPAMRTSLTVGLLGAFTTFSTFSFETVRLLEDGALRLATFNVVGGVGLGVLAAWVGISVGRAI